LVSAFVNEGLWLGFDGGGAALLLGVIPRPVVAAVAAVGATGRGGVVVVIGRGGEGSLGSSVVTGVSNFLTMMDLSCSTGVSDIEFGSVVVVVVVVGSTFCSVGGTEVSANSNCSLVIFKSSAAGVVFSCVVVGSILKGVHFLFLLYHFFTYLV
jgi:hypothetical protein